MAFGLLSIEPDFKVIVIAAKAMDVADTVWADSK
jgi:hypothetical protein